MKQKRPKKSSRHIGKRLELRRKLKGYSSERLAQESGVSQNDIEAAARGKYMTLKKLCDIANVLEIPITYYDMDLPPKS